MSDTLVYVLWAVFGYLLGSVPFGLVLTRLAGYGDIRKIGSGNIGATNVLRTGNKTLALLTLVLDAFKAGIAAYIALKCTPQTSVSFLGFTTSLNIVASLVAGMFGVFGHMFPVWLKFKGGKGVSSAFGLLLVTAWPVALIGLAIWLIMAFTFKYSSLSALTAAAAMPIVSYWMLPGIYTLFYTVVIVCVILKHHANIARLIKGQESKITFKKK